MKGNSKDFLLGVLETIINNGHKNIVLEIYNKGGDFAQTVIEMKGNKIVNLYTLDYSLNKTIEDLTKLYELKKVYELMGKLDSDIQKRIGGLEEQLGKGIERIIVKAIEEDYPFECQIGNKVKGSLKYELKPKNIMNICNALYGEEEEKERIEIKLDRALSF